MKERYLLEDVGDNNGFSLITDYDGNDENAFDVNIKSGEILPVLPLRNMVLFPGVFLPVTVGRKSSLKLIRDAEKKHKDIAVVCQRSAHTEDPKLEDLHNIGTVGRAGIGNAGSDNHCHSSGNEAFETEKYYRYASIFERRNRTSGRRNSE